MVHLDTEVEENKGVLEFFGVQVIILLNLYRFSELFLNNAGHLT